MEYQYSDVAVVDGTPYRVEVSLTDPEHGTLRIAEVGGSDLGRLAFPVAHLLGLRRALYRALRALEIAAGLDDSVRAQHLEQMRATFPSYGGPWMPEEEAELVRLFDDGADLEALAQRFGRNVGGIRSRLRQLGRDPRRL